MEEKFELKTTVLTAGINVAQAEREFFDRLPGALRASLPPELEEILRMQFRMAFKEGCRRTHEAILRAMNEAGFKTDGTVTESFRKKDGAKGSGSKVMN